MAPNNLSTFFISGKLVCSNGSRILPKKRLIVLFEIVYRFEFILADKLSAKASQSFVTCLLDNNVFEKLVLSFALPIIDDKPRVTLV